MQVMIRADRKGESMSKGDGAYRYDAEREREREWEWESRVVE